jgi:hypothetical protein
MRKSLKSKQGHSPITVFFKVIEKLGEVMLKIELGPAKFECIQANYLSERIFRHILVLIK